jgi:outer membrane protein TolC
MPRPFGFWLAGLALFIAPALSWRGTTPRSASIAAQEPLPRVMQSPPHLTIIRAQFGTPSIAKPVPQVVQISTDPPATPFSPPAPEGFDKALPINLPTALRLANARPLDIALASQRIQIALAGLDRAKVLWLPTIYLGADYYRHDGQLQDVAGSVFGTSKSAFMAGAGPSAVFAVTDAIFSPLVERQVVRARQADLQTALNDSMLAVAEAYLNVQQARGDLAGAEDAAKRTEELVRRTGKLAKGLVAPVDDIRARAEVAERRQAVLAARERWRRASAELARILRLDPSALVQPIEPPHLKVTLVPLDDPVDALIPIGLTNRPELASQQALVQATLHRLKAERLRPLIPSLLLRGAATNPSGTLAGGTFGGGQNARIGDFSARSDWDVQVVWEFQNLFLGNLANVKVRRAENEAAIIDLFRLQDRIAAEVADAYAQAKSADARITQAENGIKDAVESVNEHFKGLEQPIGKTPVLLIRPQEVVAAIQSLSRAYSNYYGAVADYDRSQFRLYRALGQPAQAVTGSSCDPTCASQPRLGHIRR